MAEAALPGRRPGRRRGDGVGQVGLQCARAVCAVILAVTVGSAAPATAGQQEDRSYGDVRLFGVVPAPSSPEGIEVAGGLVTVGTTDSALDAAGGGAASKLFGFDRRSADLVAEQTAQGEDRSRLHGLTGMALDSDGRLYVGEVTTGVLRVDLRTGTQQTWATVPDLAPCGPAVPSDGCSQTLVDRTPLPNDLEFGPDGSLFISDSFQASVFRVRPGTDRAELWFTDPRLDGGFGANGLRVSPDGRFLYLAVTGDRTQVARVYRLPLVERPAARDLTQLWSEPGAGADGIALGRSGRLYVALGQAQAVAVLEPDGTEIARLTSAGGGPALSEPASLVFDGTRLLVTNHNFAAGEADPEAGTIVDVHVGERGQPRPRPAVPR